jgi:DNA modification methylase
MGSGAIGEACLQTGRKYIGIEFDRHYFEIAVKRLENAIRQGKPKNLLKNP